MPGFSDCWKVLLEYLDLEVLVHLFDFTATRTVIVQVLRIAAVIDAAASANA